MNIDFHYGVIYAVARWAGMDPARAEIVAHACQYIDDSTVSGVLEFEDGQTFERFAAAHKMIDYRNFLQQHDKLVWAAFHFLPAGDGASFDEKCVCRPNSVIAREMVRRALECRTDGNALHRLGVTLHVYVDTWAHQNFSGLISPRNVIHELLSKDHHPTTWLRQITAAIQAEYEVAESEVIGLISKVGHGAALHFPDLPWARWEYRNALGMHIQRENLPEFVEAADHACRVIQAFLKDTDAFESQAGLSDPQKSSLRTFLEANRGEDPGERLAEFAKALAAGHFDGLKEALPRYVPKGEGSWKALALGITARGKQAEQVQESVDKPKWSQVFEDSDYRKYHDAVQEHRMVVTREILPAHGIRLA